MTKIFKCWLEDTNATGLKPATLHDTEMIVNDNTNTFKNVDWHLWTPLRTWLIPDETPTAGFQTLEVFWDGLHRPQTWILISFFVSPASSLFAQLQDPNPGILHGWWSKSKWNGGTNSEPTPCRASFWIKPLPVPTTWTLTGLSIHKIWGTSSTTTWNYHFHVGSVNLTLAEMLNNLWTWMNLFHPAEFRSIVPPQLSPVNGPGSDQSPQTRNRKCSAWSQSPPNPPESSHQAEDPSKEGSLW